MKYYLIRILKDGDLVWGYLKTKENWRTAYSRAQELFGDKLKAFEPGPVTYRKPGIEVYK